MLSHIEPSPQLKELASILADWAADAPSFTLYLYGSRARGDARQDSDVDVCVDISAVIAKDGEWWLQNNQDEFATINAKLPGRLQILEFNDPLKDKIFSAPVIYRDRNVRCVALPPKKLKSSER